MKNIITIENTENLNKKEWHKFCISRKLQLLVNKLAAENPECIITTAPYKAWSEAKINKVENERAQWEASEKRFENDAAYRQQCEDWVNGAMARQRPSSMR